MRRTSPFSTVRTEGGLLPSDLLARVVAADTALPGLDPEAYHLGPGERLNETITRSWNRLTGLYATFREQLADAPASDKTATTLTRKWSQSLLQELGFGHVQTAHAIEIDGRSYPVSHAWGSIPIHLVGARVDLDRRAEGVAGAARVSPHGLVQELLNRSDEHLWAIVSNGLTLRVLRDNASLTRQAYVEFDLAGMFDGQVFADFVLLWLVCHESRFVGDPPEKCVLEQWVNAAAQQGTRALDDLRKNVEAAITALGQGFLAHPANAALRQRLQAGDLTTQDYYRQLLRLVYRLLFVSVAEARDLLLLPGDDQTVRLRYENFYSLDRMRTLAESRRGGKHGDIWSQFQVVVRALSSDTGEPALALPALGSFLWSSRATPDLDNAQLANRAFLDAIRALSRVEDGKVIRTIDYRNLGAEELGSVYESLLELHPELNVDTATFALTTAGGHERKTTGSYYTPTSLINELLDSALDPVLDEAANQDDAEAAILKLTVLDPACGSGHFLIAAAQRIANRLASARTGDDEPSPAALRTALRDVVAHCIYGIDVNAMAVELCKVSLWMEAVEPGKPLSFLEHHIVCGNSLLGTTPALLERGIPDEAFKALTGDDKTIATAWKKANKRERDGQGMLAIGASVADLVRPIADEIATIDAIVGNDPTAIKEQERRFTKLQASRDAGRAKLHADAWCAAFVAPKVKGFPVITEGTVRQIAADPAKVDREVVDAVRELADQFKFLHLHLAFPTVFQPRGVAGSHEPNGRTVGFSVVLGNPPWDQIQYDPKEVFAATHPEIASAANLAARIKLIERLAESEPDAYSRHRAAKRLLECIQNFIHSSGRFPLTSFGRLNLGPLFVEAMRTSIDDTGRVGVVAPTGIATDSFNQYFFADCVDRHELASLYDFENTKPIFVGVHRSYKFCLLTLVGAGRPVDAAEFAFFAREPADLADTERRFTLTARDIALINPNTKTAPVFRSRRDAELTAGIYRRLPVLQLEDDTDYNPWGIDFQLMFMMNTDSELFRTATDLEDGGGTRSGNRWNTNDKSWLPLYEGKLVHHFNHRWGDFALDEQQSIDGPPSEHHLALLRDPSYVIQPRYWVAEPDVDAVLRDQKTKWLVGFRDITNVTNERTMIAAVIPTTAVGNNLPLLNPTARHAALLPTILSSFAEDFVARVKVGGTHINLFILKQLPVPPPETLDAAASWCEAKTIAEWLTPRILELTYTAWDLESFAADLNHGGPPFHWDPDRRELLRAELDAACFRLYGIQRDDIDYIMETFPIVKRKDVDAHGEYRTKRLILEVYDAMAKAIETGEPYETILSPPPADPSCAHPESTRPEWARPL